MKTTIATHFFSQNIFRLLQIFIRLKDVNGSVIEVQSKATVVYFNFLLSSTNNKGSGYFASRGKIAQCFYAIGGKIVLNAILHPVPK